MTGWNSRAVSIWNEDTSHTVTSSSFESNATEVYGMPMLPTTCVVFPAFFMISPSSVVVVVLPLVPVMASRSPRVMR